MYCPVCGAESTQGLNYCKRCGSSLGPTANAPVIIPPVRPATLLPVALVSIVGLVGFFMTIANLSDRNFQPKPLVAICAFAGATVLGVVGLMIWLLLHMSGYRHGATQASTEGQALPRASTQPQLQPPPMSVPSVTENTTRNFDALRARDRNTSE